MKPTRIFKIKGVDQNILFQLLSDKAVALLAVIISGVIAFFYMQGFSMQIRIVFVSVVGFCAYLFMSIEMEGQKLYSLVPKFFGFVHQPKKLEALREAEFVLVNDSIVMKDRLISVYKIEPIDYLLLDEDEKDTFTANIQAYLNNLRENQVQLLVRNRTATEEDYLKHFDSVDYQEVDFASKKTEERREKHLRGYKEQLKNLLQNGLIPIRQYFILIKVDCETTDKKMINKKMKELGDISDRITRNLSRADVESEKLGDKDLDQFCRNYFRF